MRLIRVTVYAGLALLLVWSVAFFVVPTRWHDQPCELDVNSGLGLRQVARQLVQQGILWEPWSFTLVGRMLGRKSKLKAGSYEWSSPPTPWTLLTALTEGPEGGWEIRVVEGQTFAQMRQELARQSSLRQDTTRWTDAEIMAKLGEAGSAPEGWFYPDTYVYAPGDSDWSILQRSHRAMQRHLHEVWQQRDPGLPWQTPYQALIVASLIEKETASSPERPRIAAVFVNRLRLGMRLQSDPTVIYGMGSAYDGHLHHHDLHQDTPFNTYTRQGLTPTPIALPGLAALRAAVHPQAVSDLYFVARGDGTHQFSATLAAHQNAVVRYQLQQGP